MKFVKLIHWNGKEASERAQILRAVGFDVDWSVPKSLSFLRGLGKHPPAAVVIDLSRLPMQGRDMALAIRHQKATRAVPIVFVGGLPEKVNRVRVSIPDAVFAGWENIREAVMNAIASPPVSPVVPESMLAGYSGAPLPKKLGIKPQSVVALINAPSGFEKSLRTLPRGAKLRRSAVNTGELTLWFVKSQAEVERRVGTFAKRLGDGKMWIAWPKQASGVKTDLTQQHVRDAGLAAGLVDFKICSIDKTWSALLFTRRKRQTD